MTIPDLGNKGLDIGSILLIAAAVLIGLPLLGEVMKPAQQGTQGSAKPTGTIRAAPVVE